MGKIYARQIPPEYQESPLEYDEMAYDYISVCGNRDYREHLAPVFERVRYALENGELNEALEDIKNKGGYWTGFYKNATEVINDLLPPEKEKYSTKDIGALKKLVDDYCNYYNRYKNDTLCEILEVVTGNKWEWRIIKGCCQGDWNEAFYQVKDWPNGIDHFEIEYFNLGTEWIVHDEDFIPEEPDDITGYCTYCYGINDDDIRREIAESYGGKPEDVVLYEFDGYRQIAKYKMVSA